MRVGVCELPPGLLVHDTAWQQFATTLQTLHLDALLLNEMPFGVWIAAAERFDNAAFMRAQQQHDDGLAHLDALGVKTVLGTRPVMANGCPLNQAFAWQAATGLVPVHNKQYFPDEPGFYESHWFQRGDTHFRPVQVAGLSVGFLICSEVMFNEWARHYRRQGTQVIAVPRASSSSIYRWRTAMAMAAIVSGCYVISSNRAGTGPEGVTFGGHGMIIDPSGTVIAETSPEQPVVCADLDLDLVTRAQHSYPCNLAELPIA